MIEARRIWLMDQRLIRARRHGKILPFEEHILSGYKNLASKPLMTRIRDLSNKCTEKKLLLQSGSELILLTPNNNSSQVLATLHGGPESYEGTEIRYLGLYRALLKKGWTIAILNYRGSAQLEVTKKHTWKNWKNSILQDFSDLLLTPELKSKSIHLLGASFGGALALIASKKFKIKKCVLLSPLLDLSHQKHRAGPDYQKWFQSRFSAKDYSDFSFAKMTSGILPKTLCLCSQKDEVLGNSMNKLLIDKSNNRLVFFKVVSQQTTHSPKSYQTAFKRFNLVFRFLTH